MHKQGGGVMYMELDLTFFAAVLKASLWVMSGFPALMRWISSLHTNRHLNVPRHFISSFHHPRYACVIGIDPTVGICATCKMERSYQLLEHFTMHGPFIVVGNILRHTGRRNVYRNRERCAEWVLLKRLSKPSLSIHQ